MFPVCPNKQLRQTRHISSFFFTLIHILFREKKRKSKSPKDLGYYHYLLLLIFGTVLQGQKLFAALSFIVYAITLLGLGCKCKVLRSMEGNFLTDSTLARCHM